MALTGGAPRAQITFFPELKGLQNYSKQIFQRDLMAGLTVALLAVPQAMAYALVAGLPLSAGLLSACVGAIVGAAFGSSKHLVMGPTNAIAILVQAATADLLYTHFRELEGVAREIQVLNILGQLTLLIGMFQMLGGILGLGRLCHFVNRSVVLGYVNGAAVAIVMGQLFVVLGMHRPDAARSFCDQVGYIALHVHLVHVPTLVVGALSLGSLLFLRHLAPRLPGGVLMLVAVSLLVHWAAGHIPALSAIGCVGDMGQLHQIAAKMQIPFVQLSYVGKMLPHAFAIALLGALESCSSAKAVCMTSKDPHCMNQEIYGLGLSNLVSACVGGMPGSGSASRSFLNVACGACTQMASISNGLFVAAVWVLCGSWIEAVPLTALSAVLLVTVMGMVNVNQLRSCFQSNRKDGLVLVVTTAAAIFLRLDVAFYVGGLLSLGCSLWTFLPTIPVRDKAQDHT